MCRTIFKGTKVTVLDFFIFITNWLRLHNWQVCYLVLQAKVWGIQYPSLNRSGQKSVISYRGLWMKPNPLLMHKLQLRYKSYLAYNFEEYNIIVASDNLAAVTRFNCRHQATKGIMNYYLNRLMELWHFNPKLGYALLYGTTPMFCLGLCQIHVKS